MEQQTTTAKEYILHCFREQGDFLIFGEARLTKMLDAILAFDAAFMEKSQVNEGAAYDDLFAQMTAAFPEHKMYIMRFVEDYLDYNEQYLDSIGAIEWE